MTGRQLISVKGLMDHELLQNASHSPELGESFERHLGSPGDELYEGSFFLLVEVLQDFPQPADDGGILRVAVVLSVVLQILD